MNRRHFVRSAALAGAALPLKNSLMDNTRATHQQWYELRTYIFGNDAQRAGTSDYLEKALIPALNRAGCAHIGVFTEQPVPASSAANPAAANPASATTTPAQPESVPGKTVLLIPFNSIEDFTGISDTLSRDKTYQAAAGSYLEGRTSSGTSGAVVPEVPVPAYQRIESSLLKAFAHMPQMEVPADKPRLFELRIYESPTEAAGQKKIEMFNNAGEIDIFKKIGARPVFFGETLIGQRRPNLTYMLCFDDMAAHDARWKAFGADPDWQRIKAIPEYSDARLISKITRVFLEPAAYSQI